MHGYSAFTCIMYGLVSQARANQSTQLTVSGTGFFFFVVGLGWDLGDVS